jgi:DNA-binding CsgD family transcriptional regulator
VLVSAGRSSKEIARQLKISPLTVRKHRENAMRKLAVHTMAELIAAVAALGLGNTPSEV